jgi:hypothetical protein
VDVVRIGLIVAVVGAALALGPAPVLPANAADAPPEGSLQALWRDADVSIGATPSTSDHGPGRNRISFILVDKQSRLIEAPVADLWLAHGLKEKPYGRAVARLVPIGVPGGDAAEVQHLYVAHLDVGRKPGTLWYLAIPRGTKIHALGTVLVRKHAEAPQVGERAIASTTPTLRSTGGKLKVLSTSRHPDPGLYASSVKDAIEAHVPFVVTFATPQFCQTRLCGPVVDVVSAVRKRFAKTKVRFIHVEVYRDNDPANGVNRWMKEWNLPTEPWTFVVDAQAKVTARFENAMSTAELVAAVRRVSR